MSQNLHQVEIKQVILKGENEQMHQLDISPLDGAVNLGKPPTCLFVCKNLKSEIRKLIFFPT